MRVALVTSLLTLLLAATGIAAAPEPSGRPDPQIADGSAARALERARERWKQARISSYSFELRRSCFLFWLIRIAIEQRYSGLRVSYGTHGVPRAISLDPSAQIADEETSYAIRRFKRR